MSINLSTKGLAKASAKHPWITILIWLLFLGASVFLTINLLGDALSTEDTFTNNPDSKKALELLEERMPEYSKIEETVVVDSSLKVGDPEYKKFVKDLQKNISGLGENVVEESVSFYQTKDASLVSSDRHTTILPITLAGSMDEATENIEGLIEVVDEANKHDQFKASMIGDISVTKDFQEISEKDLRTGELYGIMAALIILVIVFVSIVSAFIPLLLAVVAIISAVGATALLGLKFEFSFFIVNMITMMGLAVGIDYSLFIVSRFREELGKGSNVVDAIAATGESSSKAVFFSGVTVILALIGMVIVPHTIFKSLGTGAILVVFFTVIASLTLLPAILRIMGTKVNSLKIPFLGRALSSQEGNNKGGFWDWTAKTVMNRPVISLSLSGGLLILLTIPLLNINLGSSPIRESLPDNLKSKEAYLILEDKFSVGKLVPAFVVIDGDIESKPVKKSITNLRTAIDEDTDFGKSSLVVNKEKNLALLNVPVTATKTTEDSNNAVKKLRENYIPDNFSESDAEAFVTGSVAGSIDFTNVINTYTPLVFAIVLGLSFLLLTLVFRSIIVPIKAIIMNLLSVGAAYGLVVLVFQKGYGASFLGLQQVEVIEAWVPLFLFSILFGLSMDYHVFLLSRIREFFVQTKDNSSSVAFGLRSTGRIITGAAIIMVAVFGGFAAGDMIMFQQMGFGLGVAVLLDATIIRSILVPASMKLLGDRNWYLPGFLQWLPKISIGE